MMMSQTEAKISQAELLEIEEMTEAELREALRAMTRMLKKTPHGELIFEVLKFEFRKRTSH